MMNNDEGQLIPYQFGWEDPRKATPERLVELYNLGRRTSHMKLSLSTYAIAFLYGTCFGVIVGYTLKMFSN